jgi:hypothetical protein
MRGGVGRGGTLIIQNGVKLGARVLEEFCTPTVFYTKP